MRKQGFLTLSTLISGVMYHSVVSAEGLDETQDKMDSADIEIIKVHSERQPKELKYVANSISIYTADDINNFNLKDSTDLSTLSPNVKITQNAAEGTPPAISIRGVSLLDYNTANTAPVAVYVDDIVGGSVNNQIVNLFDMKQAEVLKGPQGTLFGRNTTGGAILLYSQTPTAKQEGYITLGAGTDQYQKLEGAYNLPVSENSAFRLAASHIDYQYTSENQHPTSPQAGLMQNNYRLMFKTEQQNWDLLVKLHAEDWKGIVKPPANLGVMGENCNVSTLGSTNCFDALGFNTGSNDFHKINVDNHSPHETDGKGASIHFNWDITNNLQLVSLTGYNSLQRYSAFNCDASPSDFCNGALGVDTDTLSQELRLVLDTDQYKWTNGVFYLSEKIEQDNFNDIFRDLRGTGLVPNAFTTLFLYDNQLETNAYSYFSEVDYQLTQKWSLAAGARYTDEKTQYHTVSDVDTVLDNALNDEQVLASIGCENSGATYGDDYFSAKCGNWNLNGEVADTHLSGNLSLKYTTAQQDIFYYRLASGYKSGGYNAGLLASKEEAESSEYGAEELLAHEVGTKLSWQTWHTFVQGALFYYDYRNQQVFQNRESKVEGAPPIQVLDNVGRSEIYGIDIDVFTRPLEGLTFRAGIGYLPKAEGTFSDETTDIESKRRLPLASRWNINAQSVYEVGALKFNLNVEHQSEFYFDQNQNPYASQQSFTVWNGAVTYSFNQHLDLSLWGRNLTNVEYSHLKFDLVNFLGMLEDFRADGRRVGLNLTYKI
ncbi:TonB-dependent receptor [Catenovulum sediminis]|uniref:TonB-dependent receptor n=1 Tax=Catenovulum sediminis TaxID=1740262 RepID=A0ABV1RKP3_9ALTE